MDCKDCIYTSCTPTIKCLICLLTGRSNFKKDPEIEREELLALYAENKFISAEFTSSCIALNAKMDEAQGRLQQ